MTGAGPNEGRSFIPYLFFVLFGVFILADGILIYLSQSTWTGIETEEHYRKGLAYNRVLEAERAQQALGWSAELGFEATGEGGARGVLTLHLSDREGAPLDGGTVRARFVRPTHEGYDRSLTLESFGGGLYGASLTLPLAGQWEVRVAVEHPLGGYRLARRIVVGDAP